jgi:hypothetical protein
MTKIPSMSRPIQPLPIPLRMFENHALLPRFATISHGPAASPLQKIPLSRWYVLIAGHASLKISSRNLSVIPRETTVGIRDT